MSIIRKPAVVGMFYDAQAQDLRRRIRWSYQHPIGPGSLPGELGSKREIKGLVVPHAGYNYSGPVAAHSYLKLAQDGFPETFIILSPNHTGMGSLVSTMSQGEWQTPLGNVPLDTQLAQTLMEIAPIIADEPSAHQSEHSIEVQLPFLQYLKEDFQLVPITMGLQDLETSREIGEAIHQAVQKTGRDVVVIASTDLTHYKPHDLAVQGDQAVINQLTAMDEVAMLNAVNQYGVTMCGYGPVAATLTATRLMGAEKVEVLKYATSGETGGDYSQVVGYTAAVIS